MSFDWWLSLLSSSSAAVPLIVALVCWRRLDKPMRILAGMFLVACLVEAGCWYLGLNSRPNLWLGHLWTPVEFVCTMLVFACWQRSDRARRILHWAIPAFLLLVVLNKFFLESFDSFDSISRSIGSTVIIGVAVYTFQRIIVEPGDSLARDPRFWVSSAVLIYHAGTLTLFTLSRGFMDQNMAAFSTIYTVHSVINILTNLLYAGGFLCRPHQ